MLGRWIQDMCGHRWRGLLCNSCRHKNVDRIQHPHPQLFQNSPDVTIPSLYFSVWQHADLDKNVGFMQPAATLLLATSQRSTGYSEALEIFEAWLNLECEKVVTNFHNWSVHELMLFCCKQLAVFPSLDLACIYQWLCQVILTWLILNWSCRTEKSVLASSGFQADIRALQKNLDARHQVCRSPVLFFSEFSCFSCVWN